VVRTEKGRRSYGQPIRTDFQVELGFAIEFSARYSAYPFEQKGIRKKVPYLGKKVILAVGVYAKRSGEIGNRS